MPLKKTCAYCVCLLTLLFCSTPLFAQDELIKQVSSELKKTEELFNGDLEVSYVENFKSKDPLVEFRSLAGEAFHPYAQYELKKHFVRQGERFYTSALRESLYTDSFDRENGNQPYPAFNESFSQYNGEQTTSTAVGPRGEFAYLSDKRSTGHTQQRFPNECVLPISSVAGRTNKLSVVIQGYETARRHPDFINRIYQQYEVKAEELQTKEFPHHIKITLTTFTPPPRQERDSNASPELTHRELLFLNKQKNYLPERYESYSPEFTPSDKPIYVSEVVEWGESENGVWYPRRAVQQSFVDGTDPLKRVLNQAFYRHEFTVTKCDFSPDYDDDFFNQVKIPEGAKIFKDGIETTGSKQRGRSE